MFKMKKTTRTRSTHVHFQNIAIPTIILTQYKIITVAGDVMSVNGIQFFVSKSRNIKFTTGEFIKKC